MPIDGLVRGYMMPRSTCLYVMCNSGIFMGLLVVECDYQRNYVLDYLWVDYSKEWWSGVQCEWTSVFHL